MGENTPLSDELQSSIDGFAWAKEEVLVLTEGLSDEQFNWRPAEGQWSVGECLDHLYQTGHHLSLVLREAIETGRAENRTSDGPFRYSRFGNWFAKIAGVQANPNKGKVKAPKLYVPEASSLNPGETVQRFQDLQDEMISLIREAQGLDLKRIKVSSPAFKPLRLSLGVWLKMLPNHQRRHFQQAQRVLDAMPS